MLSVIITTWNEEKNLPRVVNSVKHLADEVIVVDTESTDNTLAVAKKLGCQVYSHPNTAIVEPVRNFSIAKAHGDWILLLDADEEVTETLAKQIQDIMTTDKADYVRIPRQNYIFGKWIKSSHWWPDYVYRLFKKGAVTWKPEIHSIPMTRGTGMDIVPSEKTSLIHHHYSSISQFLLRLDRYTTIQSTQWQKTNIAFHWTDIISKPTEEFLNQYFARHGYKDGFHGLSLSLLQAFSELIFYLKIWEQTGFKPHEVNAAELNQHLKKTAHDYRWWDTKRAIDNETTGITKLILKIKNKL